MIVGMDCLLLLDGLFQYRYPYRLTVHMSTEIRLHDNKTILGAPSSLDTIDFVICFQINEKDPEEPKIKDWNLYFRG